MTKHLCLQDVAQYFDTLDREDGIKEDAPVGNARSLKRSAEHSKRRKSLPLQSAMGMLTFYINRAGDNLHSADRRKLEQAKEELRKQFDD